MAIDHRPHSGRSTTAIGVVMVIAVLYFARVVLIPFALAILLSFLLAPLVVRLRRWHFGRVPSVLCVVLFAFAVLAVIGGLVAVQLSDLAQQSPAYQQNIQKKIHSVRVSSSVTINRLTRVIQDFSKELTPPTPKNVPGEEKVVPVEIRQAAYSPLELVPRLLGSVITLLLTGSIVVVFVIFMLFQRDDLRDRLIRLVGAGQINLTTNALDDAAQRVSRYLLAQMVVNVAFGVLSGFGLYLMRVPNPILWAVLATLFRYVPYLGIWVAAALPAAVALATSPGWMEPLGIFGLFFGIDLLIMNIAEPVLYGNSTGISPLAILAAAVFWTWLWGPIGLLLSTPLTVCLVVIGRYVPSLEFLSVLLGDQQVLSPEKRFYQRLLAMELEEATDVAEQFLKEKKSLEELYDGLIIPALTLAEEDRHRGKLDEPREKFILENTRFLVEDIAERADDLIGEKPAAEKAPEERPALPKIMPLGDVTILSMPARDEADEIGALMLAQLLNQRGIATKCVSAAALASERLEEAASAQIQIVCVSAVPPFGYMHARYLCKRLHLQFPSVKVVAAILDQTDAQEMGKRQPAIPADAIATSLRQAVSEIVALVPCAKEPSEPPEPERVEFATC